MALHNTGKLGRHLGDLELEPSLHEAGKPSNIISFPVAVWLEQAGQARISV